MALEDDRRKLEALLGGGVPDDVPKHLTEIRLNTPYLVGSTHRNVGAMSWAKRPSGILAPSHLGPRQPIDFAYVYVTASDYLGLSPQVLIAWALSTQLVGDLLRELAFLAHVERHPRQRRDFTESYLDTLQPEPRLRLKQVLVDRHRLLARQPILGAMMLSLNWRKSMGDGRAAEAAAPPILAAIILAHAVGDLLGADRRKADPNVDPEARRALLLEMTQNGHFNRQDDPLSLFVRYDRLWQHYLPAAAGKKSPAAEDLLVEATGLRARELMALGLVFYGLAVSRAPGKPGMVARRTNPPMDVDMLARFSAVAAGDFAQLSEAVAQAAGEWDFLPLMRTPVLDVGDAGFIVLDEELLLQRVTTGLRRFVDDHVPDEHKRAWFQHFGKAVELMAKDSLSHLAPYDVVSATPTLFFTEDDLAPLHRGKNADAAICFGADWCVFEIVGKRMTAGSMCRGDWAAFESDVSELVFKKARQLHETGLQLLAGASERLARVSLPPARIIPVIVCPEGFPINPLSIEYVGQGIRELGLLQDPRFLPLAILDLRDLEILEALAESGVSPVEVLAEWQASQIAAVPLVNFVADTYGGHAWSRSRRASVLGEGLLEELRTILGI